MQSLFILQLLTMPSSTAPINFWARCTQYPDASPDTVFPIAYSYQGSNVGPTHISSKFSDIPYENHIVQSKTKEEILSNVLQFHSQQHSQKVTVVTTKIEESEETFVDYEYDISLFFVCDGDAPLEDRRKLLSTKDVAHLNMYVTFHNFFISYGSQNGEHKYQTWSRYEVKPEFLRQVHIDRCSEEIIV
jgi:hypothetical protein